MITSIQRTLVMAILLFGLAAKMHAAPSGDIVGVYNANNTYGIPILDGPAFVLQDFTATPITNAVLSIGVGGDNGTADLFNVGTIPANSFVVVEPGISNDGGAGHTFFAFTGSILDTSDVGPSADTVPFSFTGLLGSTFVTTGTFTPGMSTTPSVDGTISQINFLGGGPQSDGPCNDCYNHEIATINPLSTAPDEGMASLVSILASFIRHQIPATAITCQLRRLIRSCQS
jgi:hypothetical protein